MPTRDDNPRKGDRGLHQGHRADGHQRRAQGTGKLQMVVKLEPDYPAACLIVRGHISTQNIPVIFAVVRRVNTAVPGVDISVDLSLASITAEALGQLKEVSRNGMLPLATDPARVPCHVRILESSRQMA
ncbi:hypothetical protein [Arthrobacter sp. StoSoilB5]|uniref:hypothetical protein n=1 Tax=Arthrobacter sp. StoSoilB5 TaxID=2830992 RepID=UPI001CC4262E|nr:hypothetical protein [Arthrobacter sp. StoSoilB5]